uniref:NHL repeat containing 3 n=1 Tax=Phocoena sinus TaxID=42100 RepID=A0A8C9EDI1_PHOSS
MTRFWVCVAGAGFFLAFLVFHSRFCASRLPLPLHFAFKISWRPEEALYRLDVDWPKYSEYFTGATFCVAVDSLNGLVYVAQRGDNIPKVLVFTEDGYFLRAWNYTVDTPHGIFAASTPHEQSVWITDVGSGLYGHTIKKYNSFGDLVQVLGTPGKKGTGLNPLQFDNPAELYVEDTGDIYIVDGDGGLNNRLIKLSQDFMILWLHGENGTGPAKFSVPHSVTVDSDGRVWVADRGNKRIQVFDKDTGEWLGAWNNCFFRRGTFCSQIYSRREALDRSSAESKPALTHGGAPGRKHWRLFGDQHDPAGGSGLTSSLRRQWEDRSHLCSRNWSKTSTKIRPCEELFLFIRSIFISVFHCKLYGK